MDLIKILKNKLADSNKESLAKSYKNAIKVLNNKYIDIKLSNNYLFLQTLLVFW